MQQQHLKKNTRKGQLHFYHHCFHTISMTSDPDYVIKRAKHHKYYHRHWYIFRANFILVSSEVSPRNITFIINIDVSCSSLFAQTGTPDSLMNAAVCRRLSKNPQSFSLNGWSVSQILVLRFWCVGQSCRRCSTVIEAVPQGHSEDSLIWNFVCMWCQSLDRGEYCFYQKNSRHPIGRSSSSFFFFAFIRWKPLFLRQRWQCAAGPPDFRSFWATVGRSGCLSERFI